jgi:hypothetical protein
MRAVFIPNAEHAFVDMRKLRDYTVDPTHRVGKHKSRLFAAVLGMGMDDAEELRDILLQVARPHDAEMGEKDEHGQRYRIDSSLHWRGKQATIRSAWNARPDEGFPRLGTCYPMKEAGS